MGDCSKLRETYAKLRIYSFPNQVDAHKRDIFLRIKLCCKTQNNVSLFASFGRFAYLCTCFFKKERENSAIDHAADGEEVPSPTLSHYYICNSEAT